MNLIPNHELRFVNWHDARWAMRCSKRLTPGHPYSAVLPNYMSSEASVAAAGSGAAPVTMKSPMGIAYKASYAILGLLFVVTNFVIIPVNPQMLL